MATDSAEASRSASHEHATRLILIAVTLVGIAHIALLPPWEGFDEYAHWSSIQQIADTHTLPYYGRAYISADVDAYAGPMPYGTIVESLTVGMVLGLGLLTKAFFLPISVGIGALLAACWWRDRSFCRARDLLAVAAIASLIGGWWYVRNYILYGSFVGANDFLQANAGFGFWGGWSATFQSPNFCADSACWRAPSRWPERGLWRECRKY